MKKFTFITIIMFFCLPCLVFAYSFLDNITSSGGFTGQVWTNTPVDWRIDPGTLAGGNGRTMVEDACAEWDSVPNTKELCGNLTTGPVDITESTFLSNISHFNMSMSDGINDVVFDETGNIFLNIIGIPPRRNYRNLLYTSQCRNR